MVSSVKVRVEYVGTDADNNSCDVLVQFSFDGSTPAGVCTPLASDPEHDGITGLSFTSGGATFVFVWDAEADLGSSFTGTVFVLITPTDNIDAGVFQASNQITLTTIDELPISDAFIIGSIKKFDLKAGATGGSSAQEYITIFNMVQDLQNIRAALFSINERANAGAVVPELETTVEL